MGQVCIGMGIRMIKFFMRTITEKEIEKKKNKLMFILWHQESNLSTNLCLPCMS